MIHMYIYIYIYTERERGRESLLEVESYEAVIASSPLGENSA